MWNPMSLKLTPKEGGLLAKIVPKHEYIIYVDSLASIPFTPPDITHIYIQFED